MAGGTPLFPDLGKHCSQESCNQLDFLPFRCDGCDKFFCGEHRTYINHECPVGNIRNRVVHICPTCSSSVLQLLNEDASVTLRRHSQSGNCDPKNKAKKTATCPVKRCKEMLTFVNSLVCKCCGLKTCLKHRFPSEHKCTSDRDRVVHICPTCSSSVLQVLNEDASLTLRRHAESGNCNPKNRSKAPCCPVKRCKEIFNLVNSIGCKSCGLKTCLKHRFPWAHSCCSGSQITNANSNAKPNDKTSYRDDPCGHSGSDSGIQRTNDNSNAKTNDTTSDRDPSRNNRRRRRKNRK